MAVKREKRFKVKGTRYEHKRSDGTNPWRVREHWVPKRVKVRVEHEPSVK